MLDVKRLLSDPEAAADALRSRGGAEAVERLVALAMERKEAVRRHGELRHEQKVLSSTLGGMSNEERNATLATLKPMSLQVKELDNRAKELDREIDALKLEVPNFPDAETPPGKSEADNVVVRQVGEIPTFDFKALPHDEIGVALGILDFEAAARISGSRFALYRGLGARLERALASFMIDMHTDHHGYTEVLTPFLVSRHSMVGTGQLPKFEEDAFVTTDDDLFLIPTAEVPVTNIHREQILSASELPKRYVAFSPCFRREAGSYGRDTRGLTRLHQFQKVEMVQIVTPEESSAAHEALTGHAEAVLQALGLTYRVVDLCAGDLSFAAARCYDLEVWLPGQDRFCEISSCSNFRDFQARRASIRYRPEEKAKPRFANTINGSGLAIGRTVMALIENYQRADGGIDLPEVLHPYMRVSSIDP